MADGRVDSEGCDRVHISGNDYDVCVLVKGGFLFSKRSPSNENQVNANEHETPHTECLFLKLSPISVISKNEICSDELTIHNAEIDSKVEYWKTLERENVRPRSQGVTGRIFHSIHISALSLIDRLISEVNSDDSIAQNSRDSVDIAVNSDNNSKDLNRSDIIFNHYMKQSQSSLEKLIPTGHFSFLSDTKVPIVAEQSAPGNVERKLVTREENSLNLFGAWTLCYQLSGITKNATEYTDLVTGNQRTVYAELVLPGILCSSNGTGKGRSIRCYADDTKREYLFECILDCYESQIPEEDENYNPWTVVIHESSRLFVFRSLALAAVWREAVRFTRRIPDDFLLMCWNLWPDSYHETDPATEVQDAEDQSTRDFSETKGL